MNHRIWILILALFILAGGTCLYGEEAKSSNITVDFKDAPIESVLRTLSYKSGVNIVYSRDVTGLVTIRLKDVSWEKALDVILKTYGYAYDYDKEANIIRVATPANLKQEELITKVFTLNYATAAEVAGSIEKMLTPGRGKVQSDVRTNLLIITDIPAVFAKIEEVITKLDCRTPQVMIEAKMVKTSLQNYEKLGIDWQYQSTTDRPDEHSLDFHGQFLTDIGTGSGGVFKMGTLTADNYAATLEILSDRVDTDILSSPRITTLNNQEASINVGENYPFPTYERNEETGAMQITGYEERDVGIKLVVTPTVNAEGYVTMKIHPEVSASAGTVTFGDIIVPKITLEEADTTVRVKDGQTVVIAGLIKESTTKDRKKIPLLGDIPLLGLLFQRKSDTVDKTDLLIFITPTIVGEESLTAASSKVSE